MQPETPADALPTVRVLRGNPTDDDLAALLVAISGSSAAPSEPEPPAPPSAWATYHRGGGHDLRPGPDVWRRSLR